MLAEVGQDGGLVSAILLYALERDIIDAALVSYLEGDGSTWKAKPGVARTKEDIIASAGSRYTYSANTTATDEISFGDNDFLAAQVAILLDARLLVLLSNVEGLHSADPAPTPMPPDRRGRRLLRARGDGDRRPHLRLRLGRDAEQGGGRGDGERGRDPERDLRRHRPGLAARRRRRRGGRNPIRRPGGEGVELQALAQVREAGAGDG